MKSLLTMLAIVVLVAGCTKDDRTSTKAVATAGEKPCKFVEVENLNASPSVSVSENEALYVFQDMQLRAVLQAKKGGGMDIPPAVVDEAKPFRYGTCTSPSKGVDHEVIKATCIECMNFFDQPCCGENKKATDD